MKRGRDSKGEKNKILIPAKYFVEYSRASIEMKVPLVEYANVL